MSFLFDERTACEILADMLAYQSRQHAITVNDAGRAVGQDHHRARLTDHEVWLIHELREQGVSCPRIGEKFDVSVDTVKSISSGRRRGQLATGQRGRCT